MTSYITANCIIISTQCNKLGEKGQSAIQVEEVKKKSEEIPTAEAFLLRAPPTPAPEVSSLTLLQQRVHNCSRQNRRWPLRRQ